MPYVTRCREKGEGYIRIGRSLDFREDMYSLLFIAYVKDEYKNKCEDMKQTYDAKVNELFTKHGISFPKKEDSIIEKVKREKDKAAPPEPMDKETYMEEIK